jgi:hypothetical protein
VIRHCPREKEYVAVPNLSKAEISDITGLELERSKLVRGWWRVETHINHGTAR